MASSSNQQGSGGAQQPHPHIAVGSAAIPIPVNPAVAANGAPQSVFVYVQGGKTSDSEHYRNNYPVKLIRWLAITQIVIAVFSVISQVILIAIERYGTGGIGVG